MSARGPKPDLSIVIPVYNEEAGLQALFDRLYPPLDALAAKRNLRYEVIFINDGSRDRSAAMLTGQYRARPDVTRVVLFNGNYGQHMAILAGFERTRGEMVITLDADLQNPPEEIDADRRVDAARAMTMSARFGKQPPGQCLAAAMHRGP